MFYRIYSALVSTCPFYNFAEHKVSLVCKCMVAIWYVSMEGETLASSESRLFANERSERAKGMLQAKMGMGVSPLSVVNGPPWKKSSESQLFMIERSERAKGMLRA